MYLKDFDRRIYKKVGITQKQTRAVLRELEIEMRKSVIFGEEIIIHNFGKFQLPIYEARKRNCFQTGKLIHHKEHYRLKFRVQPALSKRLKEKTVYNGFK